MTEPGDEQTQAPDDGTPAGAGLLAATETIYRALRAVKPQERTRVLNAVRELLSLGRLHDDELCRRMENLSRRVDDIELDQKP